MRSDTLTVYSMKIITAIAVVQVSVLIFSALRANGQNVTNCDPSYTCEQLLNCDLTSALKQSQECVSVYKASMAGLPKNGSLTGSQWLSILEVAYHLCSTAQIQAMIGDMKAAEQSLKDADQVVHDWSDWFNSPLISWSQDYDVTKGFLLEKSGKVAEARRWYEAHPSGRTFSRLAMLALSDSNMSAASDWAHKALADDPKNATAYVALGMIFENNKNKSEALRSYEAASRLLSKDRHPNDFMPVIFAECKAAKDGIERVKQAQ
jgi:tetratricopeptide (TPR) repeat protein